VKGVAPPFGNARKIDGTFTAPKAVEGRYNALWPLEQAVDANQRSADALNKAVKEVSVENQEACGAWAYDVEGAARVVQKLSELFGTLSCAKSAQSATQGRSSKVSRLLG
jgi:hypothetical protein